jgi:hypothetical protein
VRQQLSQVRIEVINVDHSNPISRLWIVCSDTQRSTACCCHGVTLSLQLFTAAARAFTQLDYAVESLHNEDNVLIVSVASTG